MGHYHNDQPITGNEEAPDRLNRESFAQHLAEILILDPGDDCLTVSLEGEWGYGKTSIINLVKNYCKQNSCKPVIVEYNPWLAGKAETLIQDFLVQFSSQLSIPDRPKEGLKAAKELLAYSKLFNAMKFIPGAEPWASAVESVFSVVGGATKKISKLKELDLLGRKEKVKRVLTGLKQSIIVVIDDIDRLTPDEAFQVVRLVKAVADFPGTSFLLAFDQEYLTAALENHGISKSDQYIDKVVQLRVPLPLITHKDMQSLADDEFANLSDKRLTDHFEEDQDRLALIYHNHIKYIVRTPRELKRLFNHLRFVLKQTEGMVCFTDLYALSVLAIKAPAIYKHIKETPVAYVGRNFGEELIMEKPEEVFKRLEKERKEIIELCSARERVHLTEIIADLFPLVSNGEFLSTDGEDEYDRLGRVAAPKRLYVALHYQLPLGFAADGDVLSFIRGEIDRKAYLANGIQRDFIERFYELLTQNIKKIDDANTYEILQSIYDVFLFSKYLSEQENKTYFVTGFDPHRYIKWITRSLIEQARDKKKIIFKILESEVNVIISSDILRSLMIQYGEGVKSDSNVKNEIWLERGDYEKAKQTYVANALNILRGENIYDTAFAGHVFFVLRHIDRKESVTLLNQMLGEDGGIEKVTKIIGRTGSDSTGGPYSQVKIEEYDDVPGIVPAAEKELSSRKELPSALRAIYLSITTGGKYYLKDASQGEKF